MLRRFALYPPYVRTVVAEALFVWMVLRGGAEWALEEPLVPAGSLIILGAIAAIIALDMRAMRVRLLYSNLGASPLWILLAALLPVTVLEILTLLVTHGVLG